MKVIEGKGRETDRGGLLSRGNLATPAAKRLPNASRG
jgi:hypothetical protein